MRIGLDFVKRGQRVLFRRKREYRIICNIRKRLIHHQNDMDIFPIFLILPYIACLYIYIVRQRRLCPVPCLRLCAAVSGGTLHLIGGELVEKVIEKAVFIEHNGKAVGVGGFQTVIEAVGGKERERQQHKDGQRSERSHETRFPHCPRLLPRLRHGTQDQPGGKEQHRYQQHPRDIRRWEMNVIAFHGAAHFPQQGQITRKNRFIPDLHLDPVRDGEKAEKKIGNRRAGKQTAAERREQKQEQPHGQGVQHNADGILPQQRRRPGQAVWLAGQYHHGNQQRQPRCQKGCQQRGEADFAGFAYMARSA